MSEYVENSKLRNKKTNNPVNKWAKDQNRHSSKDVQTANKYVNACLTSLIIQGNANQTTVRYSFTPTSLGWLGSKSQVIMIVGDVGKLEPSYTGSAGPLESRQFLK